MTAGGVSPLPREARSYQGQRAGLVTRGAAAAIDGVVVILTLVAGYVAYVVLLFVFDPTNFSFPSVSIVISVASGFIVTVIYLALSWRFGGRSYGALVMGLRVVNYRGGRMNLLGASLRALFCASVPVGLLWVAVSRQNRSIQDVVLRTSVIYDWQPRGASSGVPTRR